MPAIETSAARDKQTAYSGTSMAIPHLFGEGGQSQLKTHKPRLDFPDFDRVEVHNWLYRCKQYFDISKKLKRLKLALYYLDGMTLYWHQNYMRSLGGQEVT